MLFLTNVSRNTYIYFFLSLGENIWICIYKWNETNIDEKRPAYDTLWGGFG